MNPFLVLRSIPFLAVFALSAETRGSGYQFTTLAGQSLLGSADGPADTAGFNAPSGVAVDRNGTVFIADGFNHTIRTITPAGVVSTLAGLAGSAGSDDGTGSAARFDLPRSVAVDPAGNLIVADSRNQTIRKVTPAGVVTTLAGTAGETGSQDGTREAARFNFPSGVAVDDAGNIYVADLLNHTIRKVSPEGIVTTLAGQAGQSGADDGAGSAARFFEPFGIAVDGAGTIYVSDFSADTIRKITPAGVVTTFAGQNGTAGPADGIGRAAQFGFPAGLAVDSDGNVYVADNLNATIRKITPGAVVTTLAGISRVTGDADGIGSAARFSAPISVATDAAHNVYVADPGSSTIRKITPTAAVTTIAGTPGSAGSVDGAGRAARFRFPDGVATDLAGNVYVADTSNHTIRKISRTGVVTTFAGSARQSGSADGAGGAARFNFPYGVAVDRAGIVYVADADNFTIRKITPAGVVTTLAGSAGNPGDGDGTGSGAHFNLPQGIAVDDAANVYVADSLSHTIRKITPAGVVTTIAGQPSIAGFVDGPASEARFSLPLGVATDHDGNIFVTDHRSLIRRISADGIVTTLAGQAGMNGNVDGVGSAAKFFLAGGIALDRLGMIYVADGNSTIRRVTPDGVVTTLAGAAGALGGTDGSGEEARFNFPTAIATDLAGDLYVADSENNTIRKGVSTTRLSNLSVRCRVGTGDQTPIMGFVLSDGAPKPLLVRGIGPTLASLGVSGVTADPRLTLFDFSATPVLENDDWGGSAFLRAAFDSVGAFPLEAGSKDAALIPTLPPGLYSLHSAAADDAGGVALVEAYDADPKATSHLINLSARTFAGGADDTLIAGFVLSGTAPKTVLIRAVGPSLARLGLGSSGLLRDPELTLFRGSSPIGQNDDWQGTPELKAVMQEVGAFDFVSDASQDAALIATLPPGVYTAHVTGGTEGDVGVALIEIYDVP